MSLQELFESEALLPIMGVIFVIVFFFALVTYGAKRMEIKESIESSPIETVWARILSLKAEKMEIYSVIFELENRERKSFQVSHDMVSVWIENDTGMLTYQGVKCIKFEIGAEKNEKDI